jgi:hypothetical protein
VEVNRPVREKYQLASYDMVKYQLTAVGTGMEWLILLNTVTCWTVWQLHVVFACNNNAEVQYEVSFYVSRVSEQKFLKSFATIFLR